MTLPEELQGAALRRLTVALEALRAAQTEVEAATAEARDAGVSINRIGGLAGVSRDKVYGWLRSAEESAGQPPGDTPAQAE